MNASEVVGEEMQLPQQQQQQQQQQPRKKRADDDKTSTNEQPRQLKPSEFDRPSRSSMSSVESMEVVHVRRPPSTAG